MSTANIKVSTKEIEQLKFYTQEKTGQKAVHTALCYFLKEARQRKIPKLLPKISFQKNFNPLKLRQHER